MFVQQMLTWGFQGPTGGRWLKLRLRFQINEEGIYTLQAKQPSFLWKKLPRNCCQDDDQNPHTHPSLDPLSSLTSPILCSLLTVPLLTCKSRKAVLRLKCLLSPRRLLASWINLFSCISFRLVNWLSDTEQPGPNFNGIAQTPDPEKLPPWECKNY